MTCTECGSTSAEDYHPYLFCELVKLGHHDPAAYLASYGFERVSVASLSGDQTAVLPAQGSQASA